MLWCATSPDPSSRHRPSFHRVNGLRSEADRPAAMREVLTRTQETAAAVAAAAGAMPSHAEDPDASAGKNVAASSGANACESRVIDSIGMLSRQPPGVYEAGRVVISCEP
mmetsp:Transcript_4437/g.13441  ORF Transcript_4437/g.13441 Transcript_4437/m.13441 type:complete len:110 (+) Transcript_4437:392-721(+)|eukprot:scaffold276303_cov26-Tisochrysis_lutea.AAC.1